MLEYTPLLAIYSAIAVIEQGESGLIVNRTLIMASFGRRLMHGALGFTKIHTRLVGITLKCELPLEELVVCH